MINFHIVIEEEYYLEFPTISWHFPAASFWFRWIYSPSWEWYDNGRIISSFNCFKSGNNLFSNTNYQYSHKRGCKVIFFLQSIYWKYSFSYPFFLTFWLFDFLALWLFDFLDVLTFWLLDFLTFWRPSGASCLQLPTMHNYWWPAASLRIPFKWNI